MTAEEVGPIFIVGADDIDALHDFASEIGGRLDDKPLFDGEEEVRSARLLGTAKQMKSARSRLYLGLTDLPAHIKPLQDW